MSAGQNWMEDAASFAGIERIERDALIRFANDMINQRTGDPADALQAAALLVGVMQCIRAGDDLNVTLRRVFRARKARSKLFDPNNCPIDTPAWGIVWLYVSGKISHATAVERWSNEVCHGSKRQIERWIAAMKPGIEQHVEYWDRLKKSADKN